MKTLAHLSDAVLRRELIAAVARDRITTAELLAHIAEFDARKLYVPEGYSSMHAYCIGELHLSEDAAAKRIQAARAARKFPGLLVALAEGRLHLTAVCLLAPHLTAENVDELIEAATHRRKIDVEVSLARRFPAPSVPELPASIRVLSASSLPRQHAPAHVGSGDLLAMGDGGSPYVDGDEHAPAHVGGGEHAPGHVGGGEHAPAHVASERAAGISERFLVQMTIDKDTYEKLRHAQSLLSHSIRSGDLALVLGRALDALIAQLEKRKLGAGGARGARRAPMSVLGRSALRNRHIPAHIRRAVWERDGGRCTFVSKSGHRCGERRFLEFDHVEPVARGGTSTVNGLRLRCRAHNQYEAERVFGAGFMERKREGARLASAGNRSAAQNRARARTRAVAEEQAAQAVIRELTQDVLAGLRGLGCRVDEARRAAQFTETLGGASLEERMRAALGYISRRFTHGSASAG
ncbi:MAG: HNH endonuclease [Bacteroidota bacterium]